MASVNKCIFIGNLGKDPEVRYMPSGDAMANFTIACSESYKDKNGVKQEKTEWVRIVAFSKLAEIIGEYAKKGSSIYIEGRLQTRKWANKEGVEQYTTEIVADRMQLLGGKPQLVDSLPNEKPNKSAPSNPDSGGWGGLEDDASIPF